MRVLVGDFSALTACEGQRIELRCPRAQFIAIRSAVFGWSNTFHMQSDCARRRQPSAADHGTLFYERCPAYHRRGYCLPLENFGDCWCGIFYTPEVEKPTAVDNTPIFSARRCTRVRFSYLMAGCMCTVPLITDQSANTD